MPNFSFLACLEVARLVRLARLARLARLVSFKFKFKFKFYLVLNELHFKLSIIKIALHPQEHTIDVISSRIFKFSLHLLVHRTCFLQLRYYFSSGRFDAYIPPDPNL